MTARDHRGSFERFVARLGADSGPARRSELKLTLWQGIKGVLTRVPAHADTAILINRGHKRIAAEAAGSGVAVAIALEESGRRTLRAEAAPAVLHKEMQELRADFGKVLVRWRPDDPASSKRGQIAALRQIDDLVRGAGARLLLELLIPPAPHETTGPEPDRAWAETVLPRLQRDAVEEIVGSGIAPALWKIEGHSNTEAAGELAALVGSARPEASILVLGGGSQIADLRQVFSCRAGSERFNGFAVGRSIWQSPVEALCRGEITVAEARRAVGDSFLAVIDAFESADRAPLQSC